MGEIKYCVYNIRAEESGILCGAGYGVVKSCPESCPRFERAEGHKGEGAKGMRTSDRLPDECREEIRARVQELGAQMDRLMNVGDGHEAVHQSIRRMELRWVLGDDGK